MKRIVVALDGSEYARQALAWARVLAGSMPDAVFHLVHAHQAAYPIAASAHSFVHARERSREAGRALLEEARLSMKGSDVEVHWVEDRPAAAVLGVAKNVKADLIAVGRRGLDPAASLFLGSVSANILHRAHVPVLVVHDAPPRSPQSVLVGADDSSHSARALAFTVTWLPAASVTALHVMAPGPEAAGEAEMTEAGERTARTVVQRTAERAGVNHTSLKVLGRLGNAVEEVVQEFRRGEYDLAVVGSRGLGTMGELVLGSVSERLSRLAQGAVVVVK